MKLFELGDPDLYKKRRAAAEQIMRAEVDRRKAKLQPPEGTERRESGERRAEPPKKA